VTVKSSFSPILSLLDRLLAIAAAVKSPTAIVVTELLSRVIGDELFVAFSALGHGLTYLSILNGDCQARNPSSGHEFQSRKSENLIPKAMPDRSIGNSPN